MTATVVGDVSVVFVEPQKQAEQKERQLDVVATLARELPPGFSVTVRSAEATLVMAEVTNWVPAVLAAQRWQAVVAAAVDRTARSLPELLLAAGEHAKRDQPDLSGSDEGIPRSPLAALSLRIDAPLNDRLARTFFSAALRHPVAPVQSRGTYVVKARDGGRHTLAYSPDADCWTLTATSTTLPGLVHSLRRGGAPLGWRWNPAAMGITKQTGGPRTDVQGRVSGVKAAARPESPQR